MGAPLSGVRGHDSLCGSAHCAVSIAERKVEVPSVAGAVDKAVEVEKQYELGSQATAKYKEWVAKATKAVGELVR